MNVLLTGQSGFIGSRLRAALVDRGHLVPLLRVDLRAATEPAAWAPHLAGVDVVINAAGIFKERRRGDLELVNQVSPCALFRAAAAAEVRLVIQFSALGADGGATSRFHLAKLAADDCLGALPVPGVSLQPSLVFGAGGASAALMTMLASLPLVPLPGDGRQRIQPIHVDDLIAAVIALVEARQPRSDKVALALVGPRALELREYLAELRRSLGLPPARFIPVPMPIMRRLAKVAALVPAAPVDVEALAMLDRGNVAADGATRELLGRAPRDPAVFIGLDQAVGMRQQALLGWLLPMLRVTLAVMWFSAGIVSIWFHPVEDSYRLLTTAGVPARLAPMALYGAAATDILFGILTLALPGYRLVWQVQILLVLVYSLVIALRLPEFLSHPFGPIVKNLPILAILWLLAELGPRRRR
jgi:uncharacterized protein YbjT (DUF2867 family)